MAAERMIRGKANHPDQNWDDMTHEQLMVEAKEELADLLNYFSKAPAFIKQESTHILEILWKMSDSK